MARKKKKGKPEIEIQLTDLQASYLTTRDNIYYQKMFELMVPYARSLTLKTTKGRIFLPPDIVEDVSVEAALKFMNQYKKKDWSVAASFGGILHYKVLESLYNPKRIREDTIMSLNHVIDSSQARSVELGDLSETLNFSFLFRPDADTLTDDPANYLFNKENDVISSGASVVKDLFKSQNPVDALKISVGLLHFIRKRGYTKYRDSYITEEIREALDFTLLEFRNRLAHTD